MSRLFEALSNLEMEQSSPPAGQPGADSPHVLSTDINAVKVVAPENDQEAKPDPGPLNEARQAAVSPDMNLHDVTIREPVPPGPVEGTRAFNQPRPNTTGAVDERSVLVKVSPESRLVALTDPNCLGAEKFRALVTRLDNMRKQSALRSFQVTSSGMNEGKTLVAGNVAITLARHSGSKTLLIEGDLHRATLAGLLGLEGLRGLGDWWSGPSPELGKYVHRLNDMPLWFLPAGKAFDQPSEMLGSSRFQKAFARLASQFEWIVVDSPPMLPIVDVNLWSRLLNGTLVVVREGVTPVKALTRGLQALDHPKLIGVVVNEATEFDQGGYDGQYYAGSKYLNKSAK